MNQASDDSTVAFVDPGENKERSHPSDVNGVVSRTVTHNLGHSLFTSRELHFDWLSTLAQRFKLLNSLGGKRLAVEFDHHGVAAAAVPRCQAFEIIDPDQSCVSVDS